MHSLEMKLANLKKKYGTGYWSERILTQLEYAAKISRIKDKRYDQLIDSTIQFVNNKIEEDRAITKKTALNGEKMISECSKDAKSYHMICAGHAHIDMNWMWGWDETVAVTLDTFQTVLDLLNEYPAFKFSQSQASIYQIVEEYAPDMLEEIKTRIKEGRWEVTASHWVEADKNMPNGESLSRHILYTKRYLSKLLDIDPDSLNLDYEPDTFGHSVNVPEILSNGGIKYYYHCRGYDGYNLYRWIAPSGKSITVYREPTWYNGAIHPSMALYVPEFCDQHHMDTMLKVYGVGDHGGGPTRRDLERIIDMQTWPVFPDIRFGTYAEYYALTDQVADQLPTVEGERNFVFTGCYTSQSRIKMANRLGEAALNEAESFSTLSTLATGSKYATQSLAKAWENVLFNQFHDIIPGSGVIQTREHAMGLFQNTMATANTHRKQSMSQIARHIDTSQLFAEEEDSEETVSEGAGVGFGSPQFKISQDERGRGKNRIFHIFNPSPHDREDVVEITIWDWQYDLQGMMFQDDSGQETSHQLIDKGFNHYWGHHYVRVLIQANVPALGYRTYTMTEADYERTLPEDRNPRVDKINEYVMENDFLKVVFDSKNASITSLIDKQNDEEMIDPTRPTGIFRLVEEDVDRGMTSWIVGRYMNVKPLTENVKIRKVNLESSILRQSLSYEIQFSNSTLNVRVSLDHNSTRLDYDVQCDWHEVGLPDQSIPQLNFYMPVGYECQSYQYDVPFGTVDREGMDRDVPGNSWTLGVRSEANKKAVMMVTDSKYGFRGVDNSMALTLIRSSFDPDPYPELGIHHFTFAIGLVDDDSKQNVIEIAYNYNHPFNVLSGSVHGGNFPTAQSFASIEEGSIVLSSLKMPEEEGTAKKLVARVYETEGKETNATLRFFQKASNAYFVDINENKVATSADIKGNDRTISFEVGAYQVATLCVEFD